MTELQEITARFNKEEQQQFALLTAVAHMLQPEEILEVGSGWGLSAVAFLTGSEKSRLVTIDPMTTPLFTERTQKLNLTDRITQLIGRSGKNCESVKHRSKLDYLLNTLSGPYKLIYIDGSHNYEDVKFDLEACWGKVSPGGCILLDDYLHRHNFDGSYGVYRAVAEVAKAKDASYTVMPAAHGMVRFDF